MLANKDKKQDLIDHCKAVANVAKEMAKYLGIDSKFIERAYWGGMFHDIGKAISSVQDFFNSNISDEYIEFFPLHHEISWAYVGTKTGDTRLLNTIYWTHGRPVHEDGGSYSDRDTILSKIDTKDIKLLDTLWNTLGVGFVITDQEDPCTIPDLYVSDGTGNKNTNAELLIVRACVISADRYVSHVLTCKECSLVAGGNIKGIIDKIVSGGITGNTACPPGYDPQRYALQNECAELSKNERTTVVRAPAGLGKTMIGVLWELKRGHRVVWVCPRNVVAEAVYKNIEKEVTALGLSCKVELYLTGQRKACNFVPSMIVDSETVEFDSDIVVTNIDSVLNPMVKNGADWRSFLTFGADIILDEFHEFVSDAPMFAAFITYMRARHRVASSCSTLLLSATPMNVHHLWDTSDRMTKILPDAGSHYPPAHGKSYIISFDQIMPNPSTGTLSIHNSVKNAQEMYSMGGYDILFHSKYTDGDRKTIEQTIYEQFGKGGIGVLEEKNISSSPVIQAAMDISVKQMGDSLCSPESSLQRIGRVCRWGERDDAEIIFVEIDLSVDRSEGSAIQVIYDRELRKLWVDHLKSSLLNKNDITLAELYIIYNNFYHKHGKVLLDYVQNQYRKGLEGSPKNKDLGLVSFWPARIPEIDASTAVPGKSGSRNLRCPAGQYFFSVKKAGTSNEWLSPSDLMSEGSELYNKYIGNHDLSDGLLNSAQMLVRLKGLEAAGHTTYRKWVKKNYAPDNIQKWFKLARKNDTPLPDFSREYDSVLGLVSL